MLGDIYDYYEAAEAFRSDELKSLDSFTGQQRVRLAFRNLTSDDLILCWVDFNGNLSHYYTLLPSKTIITQLDDTNHSLSTNESNIHIENSYTGHAFLLATKEILTVRNSLSSETKGDGGDYKCCFGFLRKHEHHRNNNSLQTILDDDTAQTLHNRYNESQYVIAGYRPMRTSEHANDEDDSDDENSCVHIVSISSHQQRTQVYKRKLRSQNKGLTINDIYYSIQVTEGLYDHETPLDTSNKLYKKMIISGWQLMCEECIYDSWTEKDGSKEISSDLRTSLLDLKKRFEMDLNALNRKLPNEARELLQSSTPIWINLTQKYGPLCAPIDGSGMCFHPEKEWLQKNGMSTKKHGGVELYQAVEYLKDVNLWRTGGLLLHEFSHAWHCKFIEDGYDNIEIINCYENAMKEGLYDSVEVHDFLNKKSKCRAYACTNAMEYFAELSTAFLGGVDEDEDEEYNKWYPFNRKLLKSHDPRAFDLLMKIWKIC